MTVTVIEDTCKFKTVKKKIFRCPNRRNGEIYAKGIRKMIFNHFTLNSGHNMVRNTDTLKTNELKDYFRKCITEIRSGKSFKLPENAYANGVFLGKSFVLTIFNNMGIPIVSFCAAADDIGDIDIKKSINILTDERFIISSNAIDNMKRLKAPYVCDIVHPAAFIEPSINFWSGSFIAEFVSHLWTSN